MIKLLQNGVKDEKGNYTRVFYSMGNTRDHSSRCITIYARNYKDLPAELGKIENDSDIMTDYFENDSVVLEPGDKYYVAALAAYNKHQESIAKRNQKRVCA